MASLLNNASLLLNPAGSIISYQEDKIYSVLPKDGTGDFTFSGGDGGTRVNQQGYIEQTPANLMTYSEVVSNWTGNLFNNWIVCAVTSDIVVAPNGTLTGDRIGDGYGSFNQSAPATPGQTYTYSVYLKNVDLSANFYVYVAWGLNGSLVSYVTAGSQINVSTLSTSEWTRLTFTATAPASGINQMQFGPCPFTGYGTNPAGRKLDVWGGMINIGSTAFPYQPTTDRLNYPRITYQNGRGALLQEPQRTNLFIQSQNFSTAYGVYNYTQTLNAAISPDGTQNASKIVETTGNGGHQYEPSFSATSGQAYTISIFVKAAERTQFHIFAFADNGVFNGTDALYDIAAGTVISGTGASIEKWPNGWYRCIRTMTAGATGTGYWGIGIAKNGVSSYVGESGFGIYMWGGQNEAGEFASTYIPTTSATVTRPIDQFFKNDSPALNTTSWTFYMSGVNIGKNQNASGNPIDAPNWSFDSGAGPYGANSIHNYNNTVYYYDTVNGAAFLGAIGSTTTKFAVTKNGTTFKFFRDGVLTTTSTLSLASNVWDSFRMYGDVDGQGQAFSNNPSTLAILPSALSDSDAQSLTAIRSGSGGNISYYGPYTIHTFTGSATFTPSFTGPVEVLVVAGGGSGGGDVGGGGGGGQVLYNSSYGVAAGTGITVTIGAGGGYSTLYNSCGLIGSNSSFGGLSALGGGGGHGRDPSSTGQAPNTGYNGGGGSYDFSTATAGNGGFAGGNSAGGGTTSNGNGGGGGAGGVGVAGTTSKGGNGGPGALYSITGFATRYAGGGGGSFYSTTDRSKIGFGTDGGGDGGYQGGVFALDGVANTGGGGGGGGSTAAPNNNGRGGSGIVIVRYLT